MASNILPRYTSELPGPGSCLNINHPLFPTYGWIPSMNAGSFKLEELRRRLPAAVFNPNAGVNNRNKWIAGYQKGRTGLPVELPTSTSNISDANRSWIRLANRQADVDKMFPVSGNMSIVFGYKPMAAVSSGFNLLGSNTGTGNFNIRGTTTQMFFNWSLGDPETSASVTWGDDIWCLLQSAERGVEIWQNGNMVGSQGSFADRNADTSDAYLGLDGVIFVQANGTRAHWSFFYCYNKPLDKARIVQLTKNPFPFVQVI